MIALKSIIMVKALVYLTIPSETAPQYKIFPDIFKTDDRVD